MMRFLLLLLMVVPQLVFADTGFTPPVTDLSVIYLSNIFGIVDGVLHGSGSQIMGAMFGVFNSAVLVIGGVIISYILSVSTLNTAHEGKVLGQKWSSIWIPVRSAGGVALLAPKATGYSMIQIFTMWILVQGAGAADAVAGAAVTYLARGGVLVQANPPPDPGIIFVAGNILKSETCMAGVQNSLANHPPLGPTGTPTQAIPSLLGSLQVTGITTGQSPPVYCNLAPGQFNSSQSCDGSAIIKFPGNVNISNGLISTPLKGMCGNVSWALASDEGGGLAGSATSPANPAGYGASDSRSIALQQVVLDVQPLAQTLANYLVPPSTSGPTPGVTLSSLLAQAQYQLVFAAADYKGIMLPYLTQQNNVFRADALNTIQNNAAKGWIVLGFYYFELSQLNNNNNQTDSNANITTGTQTDPTAAASPWNMLYPTDVAALNGPPDSITNVGNTGTISRTAIGASQCRMVPPYNTNLIDNFICMEKNNSMAGGYYQNTQQSTGGVTAAQLAQAGTSSAEIVMMVLMPMLSGVVGILSYLGQLGNAQALNIDPIITVSALGASILNLVTMIWLTAIVLFAGVSVISVVPCINSIGFGAVTALMWMLPLMGTLTVALFGAGALMAYWVPFAPLIPFVFGALGWIIIVIELMVAAPFAALALMYPGDHEHFGKSEVFFISLIDGFARPSLMVFGFFAGAILSHVGLWLLNEGYGHVWGTVTASNLALAPGLGILWGFVAGLLIYVGFVLAIINKSFSLIYELPKVLRIAGFASQLSGGGEQQAADEMKSGFTSGMQQTGKAAQQGATPKKQAGQVSEGLDQVAKDKKSAELEMGTSEPRNKNDEAELP